MLLDSRLFSFLNKDRSFTVQFFEGQKLIHDIVLLNKVGQKGFKFLREFILTFQPMISLLKPGEGLGIYIDSEDPFFRLKIETNASGQMRTLLLPDAFTEFPEKISGDCRVSKLFSHNKKASYTSVIQLEDTPLHKVVNKVLKESYQVQSEVFISEDSDQSIMYMKLPSENVNKLDEESMSLLEYKNLTLSKLSTLLSKGLSDEKHIINEFEKLEFQYLGSRAVFFKCACSRERMILGLKGISNSNTNELFDPGKDSLETNCDYCKTSFLITKKDLL